MFMHNIHKDEVDMCLFEDKLVTHDSNGLPTGKYTASVERVRRRGDEQLLVRVESHGCVTDDRGAKTHMGNSLSGYLDYPSLRLIEQDHVQYVKNHKMNTRKQVLLNYDVETCELRMTRETTEGERAAAAARTLLLFS